DGRREDPVTDGFICGKVRHFGEHVYGGERLRTPARRVGAKGEACFEPISWDEAFERTAAAIRQARATWGGESILPFCYGGSNGKFTHDALDARFFRRIGASQLARTVCAAPTGRVALEMYGKMHGVAYEDYAASQLIVIWGANPHASNIHLVPFIRAARQNGARLVVVDPRATPLARQADLHLAVRPGTDVAVALSVIRWLFVTNRCDAAFLDRHATSVELLRQRAAGWSFDRAAELAGVSARDLERFAEWYAASRPAVIRCGWGIERSKSAGSNVAAVLALPAVAGKFGVRGGGYTLSNSGAWKFDAEAAIAEPPCRTRTINMNQLGRALTNEVSPPIRVLFVYNANPLATLPNQQLVRTGLAREDLFTIVFDQVLTDTARYADVVLPATTFLEHHDYRAGYGYSEFRHLSPVIDRVGESRPNYEVFAELCQQLGVARPDDPIERVDWLRAFLGKGEQAERIANELQATGTARLDVGTRPVQFVDVFPGTADGKIRLCPESLDREAPQGLYQYIRRERDPRYPLQMISPATEQRINSTFGQLSRQMAALEMHPDDAVPRGIREGDRVRAHNGLGEVLCDVHISQETRAGVVVLPKGLWSHHTANGQTSNALAPDELTDIAGGACFNDTWVEVERQERTIGPCLA
ncbi:MAG: molybdopterin-dependent oxidoreductase, partial [Pirellulaceae bacterium]